MSKQDMAVQFLKKCALESPKTAFEMYVHPKFIHHNQYFKGDRASLMNAMIDSDKEMPNKSFTVKQIFENGDRVAVYSQVLKENMEIAVLHILRFENDKIVEMWDVGQVIEKDSPNENGMF